VEDATHEVFLVVARRLDEVEGRADLRTWLFAITLHVVRAMRRKEWSYTRRLQRYAELKRVEPQPDPRQGADTAQALRQMLGRLDEKRCTVFVLFELEGATCEEIAELTGVPVGTVYSRLHLARKQVASAAARQRRSQPWLEET
jgi:RNA polymerase sigma-70 factor (ECF subfamily)